MKKIIQFFVLFFCLNLAACSGSPLISSEDTGLLEVQFMHQDQHAQAIVADGTGYKSFSNDQGYQITLKEAVINWNQLNLFAQDGQSCAPSPTASLSINRSEDFLSSDLQPLLLADADLAMQEYCKYQIIVAPMVYQNTAKLHEGHGEANAGLEVSFHFAGDWQKGNSFGSFEILSTKPVFIEDFFRAKENGEWIVHPMHFHEGEAKLSLFFTTSYDLLFTQIDFATNNSDQQVLQIEKNLGSHVTQSYIDHAE